MDEGGSTPHSTSPPPDSVGRVEYRTSYAAFVSYMCYGNEFKVTDDLGGGGSSPRLASIMQTTQIV